MPRMKKRSSDYPELFRKLYATACQKDFDYPCEDERAAISLRHKLHTYRRVLRDEGAEWSREFNDVEIGLTGNVLHFTNTIKKLESALSDVELIDAPEYEDRLEAYMKAVPDTSEPELGEQDDNVKGYEAFFASVRKADK